MTHQPKHFTIIDAHTFEGDPYEVAERACRQAAAVAAVLEGCLEPAEQMARNAYMERNLQAGLEPSADEWEATPEYKRWASLREEVAALVKRLSALAVASGYNPKRKRKA